VAGDAGPGRPVIGREREINVVSTFLDLLPDRPAALLIEGEAGIGKSTVWLEAIRLAADRGHRVLKARPAESEARLSYAALADLVGPVFEEARSQLPDPQGLALAATLLRVTSTQAVDPRTAATAVVGVLTAVSRVCPVLVAIDDVQWVDLASQRALEFAARRLPASVGFVVTRRSDGPADAPLDLERALPPDALHRIVLESLSLASLHHILRERLGGTPTRPVIARVAEASGGNPFFAIEIARALTSRSGGSAEREPLPVPDSVQRLASERISALSANGREAVLVAASLSRPTIDTIAAASPNRSDGTAAVLEAEEASILVSERGRVRFTHPLLASAVYGSMSDAARRALHRRLADAVSDVEERARHLSESIIEPDESVAGEIEDAARQAVLRGAFDAGAELFAGTCRLTPVASDAALVRRTLGQASALLRTGDVADARRVALAAEAGGLPPALQAERLQLLAEVEWDEGSMGLATNYLEQALDVARDDPARSARISARLVSLSKMGVLGGPARALQHAERAVRQVDAERDPLVLSSLLIDLCLLDLMLGGTPRTELMKRGLALELSAGPEAYPHPVPLIWFQCVDDLEGTRERHVRDAEWARDHSDEAHASERLSYLALAEFHAGHCDLAERLIEQSCNTIEERLEVSGRFAYPFAWRSLMDAHRGRFDRARSTLRPLVAEAVGGEKSWWAAQLLGVQGVVEFVAGDLREADRALSQMRSLLEQIGMKDGLLDRTEPTHAELLVQLGQIDRARDMLARLEAKARAFPSPWIEVGLPRARAIVTAADGDVAAAIENLNAFDFSGVPTLPLEVGLNWLAKARVLRRAKQRRAAADALREAGAIFERLGAVTWVNRAREELGLVGPRRRAPDELTAAELRVAELAATGITNREIARAAFMSEKTVEAHMARVYRKLGIRSRAELGARMAGHPEAAR
jgi:DNA-binding CsgD family transcriptional regulator